MLSQLHKQPSTNQAGQSVDVVDTTPLGGVVQLGPHPFLWEVWNGQPLGRHVAIDCETTLIENHQVPQLCMVSICDGTNQFVAPPAMADQLLLQTRESQLVFHNAAFDFWVLDKHLRGKESRNWLWAAADQGRIHDTMLLGGLVQLAEDDNLQIQSLADAVQQRLGYTLDKDDYRLRYGETLGAAWETLDPGFFRYAVCDAIATWQLYAALTRHADAVCRRHQLERQYGFLTEAIQVRAAIAMDLVHRTGLHVDLQRAVELRTEIDQDIQRAVQQLETIDAELWHRYKKTGQRKTNKDTGLPKLNQTQLRQHLDEISRQHSLEIPTTPQGKTTTSVNSCWCQYREVHPLVDAYCEYTEQTKLRQFFSGLNTETIHPRYRTMVRSGRTSCSGPNIQQLPAGSRIRQAITARPGHLLFVIDYNALELRTLAAVCYQQFGFSKLREVLIDNIDPHSYAAAMFAGVSLDEFKQLPNRKHLRQQAKVFNFGLPAGFGAASLVKHAKFSYGVELSLDDAQRFVRLLTETVYPELKQYLFEDTAAILATNLQADPVQVRAMLGRHLKAVQAMLRGESVTDANSLWHLLETCCGDISLLAHIRRRNLAPGSPLKQLLHGKASTPTGRLRGAVPFTAAKNTPFQGLAADGCKQAMWDLTKAGYRIVAFIHDEFVIELSRMDDIDQAAQEIPRLCSAAMQPFVPGIPVPCEFALTERWDKRAEAVYDDAGRLQVWQPPPEEMKPAPAAVVPMQCDVVMPPQKAADQPRAVPPPTPSKPKRLQFKRGMTLPAGAVYVGRKYAGMDGKYGNPYPVKKYGRDGCLMLYRTWLADHPEGQQIVADAKQELRGKDLACWCKPNEACHADILLDIANCETSPPAAAAAQRDVVRPLPAQCSTDEPAVIETPDAVTVLHGDCRQLVPRLGRFDFIFADPPFNIGHGYDGYDDNKPDADFAQFMQDWVQVCWDACDGVMALHGPAAVMFHYVRAMDRLRLPFLRDVAWHYRFGVDTKGTWPNTHCHCLLFGRPGHTWNPDAVLVDSDRATKYNDKRTTATKTPGKRLPGTVWGIPSDGEYWGRIQGNNQERWNPEIHPNQLPIRYLQRLIFAYTNDGDRVLDPFCGSGTTGLVCKHEGRRFVGTDVALSHVKSARQRIADGFYRGPQ